MSKIQQDRLPHLEGNIRDVWSVRKTVLTVQQVEEVMRTSIINKDIPITQKPDAKIGNSTIKRRLIERIRKSPIQYSLTSLGEEFEEGWKVIYHDIVIIIISSSVSVILIIITISVIIIKVT